MMTEWQGKISIQGPVGILIKGILTAPKVTYESWAFLIGKFLPDMG